MVTDDRLRMEITNRLGVFCYYYLDYDGAVEQFELSLTAAERLGDTERIWRELYNVADALLLASRHIGVDTPGSMPSRRQGARLVGEKATMTHPRLGSRRLLAEVSASWAV